ncbi:hypothetical protein KA012_02430 [Candidatus Woesebacteria bacterium]|nr:hypothetical protein [Candidatus Woesebacteria bacterium]
MTEIIPPKFLDTPLVTYQDGIYEVLGLASKEPGLHYRLSLVASHRDHTVDEFHKIITKPEELVVEESVLEEFKGKIPKFKFGDGVRLNGINCIVLWIKYKNYGYYYAVKEKFTHNGSLAGWGGWEVEESYLQTW